ncbi:uncharacterized protein F5891DRAFT_313954 [Suillus fuscotomentosus]|uniref:Uncharacterized protein n=1 Tax=Suillus fuscotomentosus TaxID=1912939 RepID=A0AAD4HLC5_9AGAM|nr:uncharacterized protein F5891DRAFT_313954 [Suillus fuscotomentosus]KAG1900416.1 hypothetical protein F5891DRAFT_313954 [Suillus fuscotomentosus]
MPDQNQSQYAAAAHVPLIKSPGLRVPPPVHLPPDIHPLPDSVIPYFVYPYTLEPHILTVESSRRMTLAAHTAKREAYLRAREDEREWRRKEALRRVAPGFDPAATLVPVRAETGEVKTDVMDQLVDQLARMENSS